jgi:hypothetical protein
MLHDTGFHNVEGPQMAGIGLGHIYLCSLRRQPHTIGRVEWIHDLADQAAIGAGVEQAAAIHLPQAPLAMISEVEAPIRIEDEVVRTFEWMTITGVIDYLDLAGVDIYPFDASPAVVIGLPDGIEQAVAPLPREAAAVADVEMTIRAKCCSVRTASWL